MFILTSTLEILKSTHSSILQRKKNLINVDHVSLFVNAEAVACSKMCSFSTAAILLTLVGFLSWYVHCRLNSSSQSQKNCFTKLPPGPRGLPVIGSLHVLGALPHRTLQGLAKKYGPIMYLRLGRVQTIVVSSPQGAELFLKTHDTVFASRPKIQFSEYMTYNAKGMAFAGYGSYWRNVRKFCTLELLSTAKIDSFAAMRREEVSSLVKLIREAADAQLTVDISEQVAELIEDMTYRMLFGRSTDDRFELKGIIHEAMSLAGAFNLADYLPFLRPFDLQGLTRRLKATSESFDKCLEIIISEHDKEFDNRQQSRNRDFVDVMLSLMKNSSRTHDELSFTIDRTNMKAIIFDMIAGVIDTSQTAIEWTMSELIRHPRVMRKLQEELKNVVGEDRMVEETDLPNLQYLDMVVKESLRLHPVGPFLVPRESLEDVVIDGYNIPKKSRILVNTWTIGRDPNVWSDNAEEFIPERFIGSSIDHRGQDFCFIPFGSGRRGCPGMYLGLINTRFVVAQLVHCFNWELSNCLSPHELDMTEVFGLTMPRTNHLLAIPSYRLHTETQGEQSDY